MTTDEPREWTVIYNEAGRSGGLQEVSPWRPGDGLNCTLGKRIGRIPCGRPAAVLRSYDLRSGRTPETAQFRIWVTCANHLAQRARQAADGYASSYRADGLTTQADREAREYVLEKYWDEYMTKRDEVARDLRDNWMRVLPESLREAARKAVEVDDADPLTLARVVA